MPRIIDVTAPLSADLPTFPGDPRFHMEFSHKMEDGKPYNVAKVTMGVHSGTHVDAPYHFLAKGATVETLPLEILMGKVRVVQVASRDAIDAPDIDALDLADDIRIFFKTRMSGQLRSREFQEDFVHLTPAAAARLVQAGIKLVGIDYLSVEKFQSPDFGAHHALLEAGVIIVEGLDLSEADPGEYEMACLPLPIVGADGSPARVVLRKRT
jgi:arylformamidase